MLTPWVYILLLLLPILYLLRRKKKTIALVAHQHNTGRTQFILKCLNRSQHSYPTLAMTHYEFPKCIVIDCPINTMPKADVYYHFYAKGDSTPHTKVAKSISHLDNAITEEALEQVILSKS